MRMKGEVAERTSEMRNSGSGLATPNIQPLEGRSSLSLMPEQVKETKEHGSNAVDRISAALPRMEIANVRPTS